MHNLDAKIARSASVLFHVQNLQSSYIITVSVYEIFIVCKKEELFVTRGVRYFPRQFQTACLSFSPLFAKQRTKWIVVHRDEYLPGDRVIN